MPNKSVIDADFEPNELVREVLNPSFAVPVTAFQREVLAIRERLGPRLLQKLSSLLNDGVDAVTAILAVKQQDLHQFKREQAQIRRKAKNKEAQIHREAATKEAQIRREAATKEAEVRQEAHAGQHKGAAKMKEKGQITHSAVRAEYPGALIEVRKAHDGNPFWGDHGKAAGAIAKKLNMPKPTVYRHLQGLGPRSNKASE